MFARRRRRCRKFLTTCVSFSLKNSFPGSGMPAHGSQSWEWGAGRGRAKKPRKVAQTFPQFEPNSSRRLRAPTGEPLLYSQKPCAVRRRNWLDADDNRRVIESRTRIVKDQVKKRLKNPYRERFQPPKGASRKLEVGKIVTFVPPLHAKAQSAWKAEVIGFVGKGYVVLDRSPALKSRRRQCHIEVVSKKDCWS